MKIIDTHCDVLYQLQMAKRHTNVMYEFRSSTKLDASLERLKKGGVYVQFFALFVDPTISAGERWEYVCEQVELFHTEIIDKNKEMKQITNWSDVARLQEGEIGAVLSLEGIEPIGDDVTKLIYLYEQGVLSMGLTWNKANVAADGALERYHGGLTPFGKEIVKLNNQYGVLTDVSHLSEQSFWDVLDEANYVFASHSNVRTICNHPRNLSDVQLSALFARDSLVNVTFYPPFIESGYKSIGVTMNDLIRHIKYMCSLGGLNYIGFGSDFDGIDEYIDDLRNASHYKILIKTLLQHFTVDEVNRFAKDNFLSFISQIKRREI